MSTNIINILLDQGALYILPPLVGFVWFWVARQLKHAAEHLPSNVRKLLWDYANTAVKSVEVEHGYGELAPEVRQEYARDALVSLLPDKAKKQISAELIDRVIKQVEYEMAKEQAAG
jgi:hypothetical protein